MEMELRKEVIAKQPKCVHTIGVIHIVRTHEGGRGGLTQMRTSAYEGEGGCQADVRTHKNFFCIDFKGMIRSFFCLFIFL